MFSHFLFSIVLFYDTLILGMVKKMQDSLEKVKKFFDADLKIKHIIADLAPNYNFDYSYSEEYGEKYSRELEDGLEEIRYYFHRILSYLDREKDFSFVNQRFDFYKNELILTGVHYDKLISFYQKYFCDMNSKLIDYVGNYFVGYTNFKERIGSVSSVSNLVVSINDFLHLYHSMLLNDEELYQKMPVIDSKINTIHEPITLYGEKNPVAQKLFDEFPLSMDCGTTDVLSFQDTILFMIRDRGHALTIEITGGGE